MCVVGHDKKQIYQRLLVLKVQCYLWVSRWHTPNISFRWMCVHICAFKSALTPKKLCGVVPAACGVRFWEGICPCLVSIAEREWLAQIYPNGYASNYYYLQLLLAKEQPYEKECFLRSDDIWLIVMDNTLE